MSTTPPRLSLAALALVVLAFATALRPAPQPALAVGITIAVTTNQDEFDNSGSGTGCALREAVKTANDDADFGGCARVGIGGLETILVPSGAYTLTRTGADAFAVTGDLDLRASVTVSGTGAVAPRIGLNPALGDRAFEVISGTARLQGLDLIGVSGGLIIDSGAAAILNTVVISGHQFNTGAGIFNLGAFTMTNGLVYNNLATVSHGGGILNSGAMSLTHTVVHSNTAGLNSNGGGIYNDGFLLADHLDLLSNAAPGISQGGGLYSAPDSLVLLRNSHLISNSADKGGGLHCDFCTVTISGGAVLSNVARANGGGLFLQPAPIGGGQIGAVTIAGNQAVNFGGGLFYVAAGDLYLYYSTITANTADTDQNGFGDGGGIHLEDTAHQLLPQGVLIAGNSDGPSQTYPDCSGTMALDSEGFNLIGNNAGCPTASALSSDQVGTPQNSIDPLLGPLADNGGDTLTFALLPGSPALDMGDLTCFPALDQRGLPRPQDGDGDGQFTCDIGAYEAPSIFRLFLSFLAR